jgi:hypothetical protein
LATCPSLQYIENIADLDSRLSPPPQLWTEVFPDAGAPLSDYITEPWECDAEGCFGTRLQNNPYILFARYAEDNYVRSGMTKKGMKTYYDTVLK